MDVDGEDECAPEQAANRQPASSSSGGEQDVSLEAEGLGPASPADADSPSQEQGAAKSGSRLDTSPIMQEGQAESRKRSMDVYHRAEQENSRAAANRCHSSAGASQPGIAAPVEDGMIDGVKEPLRQPDAAPERAVRWGILRAPSFQHDVQCRDTAGLDSLLELRSGVALTMANAHRPKLSRIMKRSAPAEAPAVGLEDLED